MSKRIIVLKPLELQKAKKMAIGTVSRGRKKVAEGRWVPVSQSFDGRSHPAEKIVPGVKIGKVLSRRVYLSYQGENYVMNKQGVIGLITMQSDGKPWYSYGGKLNKVDYSKLHDLRDAFTVRNVYNKKSKAIEYYYK